MELSGLIFVALALVWAVVLLPKALRHHDEVAQTRSVDRVSDGMRVLARREVVSEREARLVRTVRQAPAPAPALAPASAPASRTAPAVAAPSPIDVPTPRDASPRDRVKARIAAQRKASAVAARRRRRILLLLVAAAIGVGVAAGLGRLAPWSVAVPVGAALAFLVLARILVRRERARWDAELLRLKTLAVTSPVVAEAPVEAIAAEERIEEVRIEEVRVEEVRVEANEQGLAVVSGLDDTSSFPMGLLDDVTPTLDAGSLWDPVPVTLPTYVSKPRASRSVRTIDLQAPGVSSSGHDAASSALVADAATSSPPDDLPQRAVGS